MNKIKVIIFSFSVVAVAVILGLVMLFVFTGDKPSETEPTFSQEVSIDGYYGDDIAHFIMTTRIGGIVIVDYGDERRIDSLKCIRRDEVWDRYKVFKRLNQPCEK